MSILNIKLNNSSDLVKYFPEYINYNSELKDLYGEVHTPYSFITEMLSIIPQECFKNKNWKWLDTGAGHGNYSICLFTILFKSLKEIIPDDEERKEHIIKNMIYMVEINNDSVLQLREKFGGEANIFHTDYLLWKTEMFFDCIIGNPPYNCNGVKKVPTKSDTDKKADGKTIWPEFIKKNISLLKEDGKMNVLIPSIWLKPDKAGMYELLLKYQIEKMHTINADKVMKIFNYEVQTPICYFLFTKRENNFYSNKTKQIQLYDSIKNEYNYFKLKQNIPIPLCFSSIVNKCLKLVEQYGNLKVIKTNMPKKSAKLNKTFSSEYPFKNIRTTTLTKEKHPELQVMYSNEELSFSGEPKIVMAHKMYGFPYVDKDGTYGICSRDNYIIKNKTIKELEIIKEFLSTELILFLFETTRYRMRYLEKYVFEYIPDFSKMPLAIEMYKNKVDVYQLFNIEPNEKDFIERYYKIKYNFFIT